MIHLMLIYTISIFAAQAKELYGVRLLDLKPEPSGIVLTLRAPKAPVDSYFFVHLRRTAADSFDLLAQLADLMHKKKSDRINLGIDSFSENPSGSHYDGSRVTFLDQKK